MVEQQNIRWWKSRPSDAGTVERLMMEQWNNHGGTVQPLMVEQWNIWRWNNGTSVGGTVEYLIVVQWDRWWNG